MIIFFLIQKRITPKLKYGKRNWNLHYHDTIIKFGSFFPNCGSLENWFSINYYMFVITCLYLYISYYVCTVTYDYIFPIFLLSLFFHQKLISILVVPLHYMQNQFPGLRISSIWLYGLTFYLKFKKNLTTFNRQRDWWLFSKDIFV